MNKLERANIIPPRDDTPMAVPSQSLIQVLSRVMENPSVDVEKVERFAALYERAIAREDEIAFNNAMQAAQEEMRPIAANASNPQTKSRYAKYDALDNAVRPIYSKHGFSLSYYQGEGAPEGSIRVQCKLSRGGHTERPYIDMPADGKGAKGGDVMTKTHATGAGVTYGRRYLLGMIFNLVIGEDRDGNDAVDTSVITQAQVETIIELMDAVSADKAKFLNFFQIEKLGFLPAKRFDEAVSMLKAKQGGK